MYNLIPSVLNFMSNSGERAFRSDTKFIGTLFIVVTFFGMILFRIFTDTLYENTLKFVRNPADIIVFLSIIIDLVVSGGYIIFSWLLISSLKYRLFAITFMQNMRQVRRGNEDDRHKAVKKTIREWDSIMYTYIKLNKNTSFKGVVFMLLFSMASICFSSSVIQIVGQLMGTHPVFIAWASAVAIVVSVVMFIAAGILLTMLCSGAIS